MAEFGGEERRRAPRTQVSNLSYALFGGTTYVNDEQVICNIKVGIVIPSNPSRISLLLTNNSDSDIYLSYRPDVSTTKGTIVAANGGTFKSKFRDDGEMCIHELYGTGPVDGLKLTLMESLLKGI